MSGKFSFKVEGVDGLVNSFLMSRLSKQFDEEVERGARKMANSAAHNAPRDTGRLANSFPPSVSKEKDAVWIFGSDLPYATRQEYEHPSMKAFTRRAIWDNKPALYEGIARVTGRIGK